MSQTGYTPISLYYSTTAAAVPVNTNLVSGELAINITDGKLYYKDNGGTVRLLASNATSAPVLSFSAGTTGFTPSTATTGAVTLAGTLATTNGGTGLTSFTSGGVVYASSTSALATGSGLTFDGTNSRLFLNTTSSVGAEQAIIAFNSAGTYSQALNTRDTNASASGNAHIVLRKSDNTYIGSFGRQSTDTAMFVDGNEYLALRVNQTEGMRLTSTGLGIGTSSPAYKLDVEGNFRQSNFNSGSLNGYFGCANTGSITLNFGGTTTPAKGRIFYSDNSDLFAFYTNSTERMRLDSAGNLGLGVTPSAWSTASSTRAMQFPGGGTIWGQNFGGSNPSIQVASNAYLDSVGYKYFQSNFASQYQQNAGTHAWQTAASGTAGNAITWTQAMTLSAAGGLSVGTTADPGAGAIYATGNITAYYSDARLKTVSGKIENALDKVAQLSGVYYTNNSVAKSFGYDSDEVQVGVLAQDVEAVLPQIVKAAPFDLDESGNSKSGENYKTVQYERLVPLLIEAINELQAKVKALEAK